MVYIHHHSSRTNNHETHYPISPFFLSTPSFPCLVPRLPKPFLLLFFYSFLCLLLQLKTSAMTSKSISSPKSDTSGRSASFHGRLPTNSDVPPAQMKRPESHPELLRRRGAASGNPILVENGSPRLTKLLLNVTIQRSLGPVHVVMSPESAVADLTKAALEMYVKEGRRPLLAETDPESFELHYSLFSLESLNPDEKLINLGSRNFFLCPKPASVKSCSNEAKNGSKASYPLSRFMEFLL